MPRLPDGFYGHGAATEVAPRTFFVPSFANVAALATDEGLLLVDCGLALSAPAQCAALRALCDLPVHTVVFTHGHVDHAFGVVAFDEEAAQRGLPRPRRIAHQRVAARFRRYAATRGWNEHVNKIQFALPSLAWPDDFPWPDESYADRSSITLGGERFELFHAMGETDDATWVWAPSRRVVCAGDLFIGCSPNCGNPQKVQRYAEEWADALEAMRVLRPEVLLPGHGPAIAGADRVDAALGDTARWLRSLVEQTLERMNRGERPDAIAAAVKPPPDLADRPYLQPLYDRPEFVVRNVLRRHGGWWNGNAADLLPASEESRAREIARLAGGVAPIVTRARELAAIDLPLACHLADWATRADPCDRAAQEAKRDLFRARSAGESSLMGRGIFDAAVREAEAALRATG